MHVALADAMSMTTNCLPYLHATGLTTRVLIGEAATAIRAASAVRAVAVGKAAGEMMAAIVSVVGSKFTHGIAVSNTVDPGIPAVRWLPGGHPVPNRESIAAGRAVRNFLDDHHGEELTIFAVSGGASSIVTLPFPPLTLHDVQVATRQLLRTGMDVTTINRVRTGVSQLHGGHILSHVRTGSALGLILCDNVQIGARGVGSGLTYPVAAELREIVSILSRTSMTPRDIAKFEAAAIARRRAGRARVRCRNIIVADPAISLHLCKRNAARLGYEVRSLGPRVQGEARSVASTIGTLAQRSTGRPGRKCIIGTGEVTVTVRGNGQGGRCQELSWAMAREIRDLPDAAFVALSSDGQDYLPGVMGAYVTNETYGLAQRFGYDWSTVLDENNSNAPLQVLGQCIPGVHTGTNVCDLYVLCFV